MGVQRSNYTDVTLLSEIGSLVENSIPKNWQHFWFFHPYEGEFITLQTRARIIAFDEVNQLFYIIQHIPGDRPSHKIIDSASLRNTRFNRIPNSIHIQQRCERCLCLFLNQVVLFSHPYCVCHLCNSREILGLISLEIHSRDKICVCNTCSYHCQTEQELQRHRRLACRENVPPNERS